MGVNVQILDNDLDSYYRGSKPASPPPFNRRSRSRSPVRRRSRSPRRSRRSRSRSPDNYRSDQRGRSPDNSYRERRRSRSPERRRRSRSPRADPDKRSARDSRADEAKLGDLKKTFPVSAKSHFDLVPGHQNTTTKEPMKRPPDMRLVTAMASKGGTLAETMSTMNTGPSGRTAMLQTLTTRDVVMIPDLFEESSGFVMPPDPWPNGRTKTIYQRLVEEIHHAGKHEARGPGGNPKFVDKCFSTGQDGLFKEDAGGLFKAWHKTTPQAAGDGLAAGRDGNGHLIVNDRDSRWQMAQQRGEAPMYTAVHARIEEYFAMKIQGKRYNHYRDMTNWKPFHHDAAALDKKGRGKPMHLTQNMTVGVSFGEARQAGFEWAGSRERCSGGGSFPEHLLSPPVNGGRGDKNIVLSLTLPDSSTYIFGRDVNLQWKHGILAEKAPSGGQGVELNVEEGRESNPAHPYPVSVLGRQIAEV